MLAKNVAIIVMNVVVYAGMSQLVAMEAWPERLTFGALAALAVLVHLWVRAPTPRAAFLAGFFFGLGFFLVGVSWVYVSLHRFGAMPAPLAAFATLGFCAFLALFPALAGWTQAKLRAPLAIPALWVFAEWLRGTILTGFPWLSIGNAAIDTPLAGFAPVGGVYLLSLLSMIAAGLLWLVAGALLLHMRGGEKARS